MSAPSAPPQVGWAGAPQPVAPVAPPISATATIVVRDVSKWYGDVVAVSGVSFGVEPGVTALLGPNGAGKSTMLEMITGLLAPSQGTIRVLGKPVRGDPQLYRQIGLVPEQETLYPFLTGREFVHLNAVLQKLPDPDAATEHALRVVEMVDQSDRALRGYSKGMRQRIKVAAALVHDPDVLLMDEPLNGTDPLQRAKLIELIQTLGRQGKTLLVSSHILYEVERFADRILVINHGKLAAAGDFHAIRDKIDEHARAVRIRCSDPRRLASELIGLPAVVALRFEPGTAGGDGHGLELVVETADVRAFYRALPPAAQRQRVHLYEVAALDESLASVFAYVVGR
jgi:ABC-2 type transport system ATP-binding protein